MLHTCRVGKFLAVVTQVLAVIKGPKARRCWLSIPLPERTWPKTGSGGCSRGFLKVWNLHLAQDVSISHKAALHAAWQFMLKHTPSNSQN